jgi:hypothetical protein
MAWLLGFGSVALAALGCGSETCKVTGTVTFDGQLLPAGDIIFNDVQGVHGPEYAKINNGQFGLKVRPGDKRVEIRASREVPEKRTPMGPHVEDYIPSRYYGAQSELTAHITPDGDNRLSYSLTSEKK